ncbi:hypothetical protein QZH41_013828 [Actinostola sp. cb2023]|nr:hypothetical protein QZH41_013828 [Actinostola sp. cb2023]
MKSKPANNKHTNEQRTNNSYYLYLLFVVLVGRARIRINQTEVYQALNSLLDEIRASNNGKIMHTPDSRYDLPTLQPYTSQVPDQGTKKSHAHFADRLAEQTTHTSLANAVSCQSKTEGSLQKKGFEFCLKDEQISCLRQLFLGKDLLAVLPTGFGKSMIFQSLVLMAQRRSLKDGTGGLGFALIITPLNSIIKDQIEEVNSIGLTACSLAEQLENLDEVMSGKYMFVYASAESVVDKRFLTSLKKASCFRDNLVACVVDETHTVETWTGMRYKVNIFLTYYYKLKGAKSKARTRQAAAFRAAYGELAKLRSFLKEGAHNFTSAGLRRLDRRYITKARQIVGILEDDSEEVDNAFNTSPPDSELKPHEPDPAAFRIQTRQSLYIDTFHAHHHVRITIDSCATGNKIRHSLVKHLGFTLTSSSQSAHQADGSSPMHVVGETRLLFTRDNRQLKFEALVIENLDVLAGIPFMETNNVAVRPAK